MSTNGVLNLSVIADEAGAIWVSGETVVIRIDPQTRRIRDVIEVGSGGQLLAAEGGPGLQESASAGRPPGLATLGDWSPLRKSARNAPGAPETA